MIYRRIYISILFCCCALAMTARERTVAEKKALAAEALAKAGVSQARSRQLADLKELRTLGGCSLVGFEGGPFAVVANDEAQKGVLGVSASATSGDNPAFEWWLSAINEVLEDEAAKGSVHLAPGPDPKKYPPTVAPLVSAHWGQGAPFYRFCPSHPDDVFCATGCVATALAQILYSHRQPVHGFGTRTIYYPYQDTSGQAVTANFGETYYDWDNMIDDYRDGDYTQAQADAVATLMLHCAVAADMQFGGYNHGGSGTTQARAAEGLRYYFGFENAKALMRAEYSDDDWMDMVYGELSRGDAILYGGQNTGSGSSGGHAFVICGYNEDGLVYVNWGWNGDAEGYYDIEKLNPNGFKFSAYQDMIIGISGQKADLQTLDITLSSPGTLSAQLPVDALNICGTLKVSGRINSTDLATIRSLAGRDSEGNAINGNLTVLDLSEAEIVAGGEPYLTENGVSYTTADGELPYKAFYDCRKLTTIRLPKVISRVGDGAFGGCYLLQTVEWGNATTDAYVVEGDAIFSSDKTRLLAVIPVATGAFTVPEGVTSINPLAFAGCVGLDKVSLPASITEIGGEAFRNAFSLTEIRLHSKEQPKLLGYDTFAGVRTDLCRLLIPSSASKADYTNKAQWRDFGDNIVAYGTTLTARNNDKDYGDENPRLGYRIDGENVAGVPELSTTATVFSLPGEYPIHIAPGTVTDPDVEYVDGVLTVYPALLTVKVVDAVRRPDEVDLPYQLQFTGFVNGEDASILQELPVVTTDAANGSAEGSYVLKVSGGRSDRYEFKYLNGTLTVDANAPSGIKETYNSTMYNVPFVYDLQGRKIVHGTSSNGTLPKGVYVRNKKKVIITQ